MNKGKLRRWFKWKRSLAWSCTCCAWPSCAHQAEHTWLPPPPPCFTLPCACAPSRTLCAPFNALGSGWLPGHCLYPHLQTSTAAPLRPLKRTHAHVFRHIQKRPHKQTGPFGNWWYKSLDATAARYFRPGAASFIAAKVLADTVVFGPLHIAAFFTYMTLYEGGSLRVRG